MKAAVRSKYGPPDILEVKEVAKPSPGDNEVLIRVYAATVNRTDCGVLLGKPFPIRFFTGLFKPKSAITGIDFAGKIESIGKNVSAFKVGDKVWGFGVGFGTHAQYIKLSERKTLAIIPDKISYEQAVASGEDAHYAYNCIKKIKIRSGHKVLLNGATGAIGSALLQFLKYFEAHVTAVCNTKNIELVKSLGADNVIDYLRDDFTKQDQKYDFVFDAVGKSSFAQCKRLLEPAGVFCSTDGGQDLFLALISPIIGNKKVKLLIPTDTKGSILFIRNLIEKGRFIPVIDRKYPLEKIAEAYKYVASGQKTGNVIITLEDGDKF